MMKRSILQNALKWLLVTALLGFGFAMAQSEPTLNQVYEAAQSGRLEQAQVMMQQVLVAHPGSGKAHFVQAELFARQGKLGQAREALAMAEKLSPGLPSIKAESVQALRSQLAAKTAPAAGGSGQHRAEVAAPANYSAPASSSFPWGLALALGGGAIAIAIFLTRKKSTPAYESQPVYANQGAMQGGLSGPQGFGMANSMGAGVMQPPYGQPAGSGLGGKIMGGVATGLAVGAGVMAAQAIGRNLMGNHDQAGSQANNLANNDFQTVNSNPDMGGQNFGVSDAGSWDDGGGVDIGGGGGGDWDN
ncbi:MAG: tetratricopeptide repeat protein [Rhodoferax sp.]|uniref:tetratricopeptide repeat protein n=1 Tax=Rhodoferax sp. TaxID=50421 RepID=UPI002635B69D|nr:tetratricopeptide repeat protein [Rhodoferax sp.]MDD5335860.1 tetratricopeptide repeat protein [Rhodoferax sp.]